MYRDILLPQFALARRSATRNTQSRIHPDSVRAFKKVADVDVA